MSIAVDPNVPAFITKVLRPMNAQKGDHLPVSSISLEQKMEHSHKEQVNMKNVALLTWFQSG
jgi:hypothetical protein